MMAYFNDPHVQSHQTASLFDPQLGKNGVI